MILGLGNDTCDIRRIERTLERYGSRFVERVFTDHEIARAERKAGRAATYAKRFAAKEACAKALGTGVPRRGVHWRHMGVINLPSGKPTMQLTGGAADRLDELLALLRGRAGAIVVYPLWPGAGRDAKRVLVQARVGVATPLRLAPGLVLHDGDGFTPQARAVLEAGEALAL